MSEDLSLAVVGMACRVPGADSVDALLAMLRGGREALTRFGETTGRRVPVRGVLTGIEDFDPGAFGYTRREAEVLDPQHRLALMLCWEALERAGHAGPALRGSATGVYLSANLSTYLLRHLLPSERRLRHLGLALLQQGNCPDTLASRVAYRLGLTGPALAVQTACSSSLVATHLACQALLTGECDLALAGGVSVMLPQEDGYDYIEGGLCSPDGRVKTFDASADGTVFSNGAGVVVLRRLADALADGDIVHAVILGSAVNSDGDARVGFTAPSVDGQAAVVRAAQAMAGVSPREVGYIECHGTGTAMGDPIEVQALAAVFGAGGTGRCRLGSIKPNLGHLDNAAGVVGLIAAVGAVRDGIVPGTLHFTAPNPHLPLEGGPFVLSAETSAWIGPEPRVAGVSAFGIGGTNAHVVLGAPPAQGGAERAERAEPGRPQLLVASAPTQPQLERWLQEASGAFARAALPDLARTLAVGRAHQAARRSVVCADLQEAQRALASGAIEEVEGEPRLVFAFPGQGAEYAGMGLALAEAVAEVREALAFCAEVVSPLLGRELRSALADPEALRDQAVAHAAVFSVSWSVARALMALGAAPAAVVGHSLGEYAAAALAGALAPEAALRLVVARGRLLQALPEGAMLSVSLPAEELAVRLPSGCSVAAENAPRLSVASGPPAAIEALAQALDADGIEARRLPIRRALHSEAVEPAMDGLREAIAAAGLGDPALPMVSAVSGGWLRPGALREAAHWEAHLRQPVRFSEALQALSGLERAHLVEVGPGTALSTLCGLAPGALRATACMPHPHLEGARAEPRAFLAAIGRLWQRGAPVDLGRAVQGGRRIELPPTPLALQRCWIEPGAGGLAPEGPEVTAPTWVRAPAVPVAASQGCWLVYTAGSALGRGLVRRLTERGCTVTVVSPGERLDRLDRGLYTARPGSVEDHEALLAELRNGAVTPSRIVHLYAAEGRLEDDRVTLLEPVALCRALVARGRASEVAVTFAARGIWDVLGDEILDPLAALLIGPVLVAPQEHRELGCRLVDLPAGDSDSLCDALIGEALHPGEAPEVALRGCRRWIRRWEPLKLPDAAKGASGGVLITGGSGGLARALATALVERGHRTLVLLSRQAARGDWLQALAARGVTVHAVAGNATVRADLQRALSLAEADERGLAGVVHAAGVPGSGPVATREADALRAVVAPKLRGALHLVELLAARPGAFLLLCSSVASHLGGPGQVDYVSANAALDAVARSARQRGVAALSVGLDTLKRVGMAARAAVPEAWRALHEQRLAEGLEPEAAAEVLIRALEHVLPGDTPEIVVSAAPFAERREAATPEAVAAALARARARAAQRRPDAGAYVAPSSEIEQAVADVFAEVLGADRVGASDDFFDLGGHSLLAAQAVARLRELFDVDLPVLALFEGRRVDAVAARIEDALLEDPELLL